MDRSINGYMATNAVNIANREFDCDKTSPLPADELMKMFYRLELAIGNIVDPKEGCWNYIPFSHGSFYKTLKELCPIKKFLEIGCGVGTKLYIASQMLKVNRVAGLEINPALAKIAKSMFGQYGEERTYWADRNVSIIEIDALEFENYGDYDVIYTYTPAKGHIAGAKIYSKVIEQMKPGAKFLRVGRWEGGEKNGLIDIFTKK